MTEYLGKEHPVCFRWLSNGISKAISREEHFALNSGSGAEKERWVKWQSEIGPALRGSAIVTMIATVEHLVGKRLIYRGISQIVGTAKMNLLI